MKLVVTVLAEVDIAHQATRDSIPISFFVLLLPVGLLPLIIVKFMGPSVETKLTHIISTGGNSAMPLPIKPICEKSILQSDFSDSARLHGPQIFISSCFVGEIC